MTTEDRLRESLRRRAEAVHVAPTAWTHIAAGSTQRRQRRRLVAVAIAVPVAAALMIAALSITSGGSDRQVRVVDSGSVPRADLWFLNSTPAPHADVVDTATHAKRGVGMAGLSPDLRIQHAVRRAGGTLVVDQSFGNTVAPNVFVVQPDGSSNPLAEGSAAVPSVAEDRVWIVSRDAMSVREVDLTGRETISTHQMPPGFLVGAAVDDGLVGNEQAANRQVTSVSVWDPVTNTLARRWPGSLLTAGGRTVVWGDQGGRVHLTDERTGAEKIVAPDQLIEPIGAGISPDGRTIALLRSEPGKGFTFAFVDVATARVTHVDDWRGQTFGSIGWSADSSWVYFAGAPRDHDPFQLFAVRRGATKVTPLQVTVENFETATVGPGF